MMHDNTRFGVLHFSYKHFSFENIAARDGHYSINIGDYMQSIAVRHLYRKIGVPDRDVVAIDRDTLAGYRGEPLILVMNACFYSHSFPVPESIIPVFVGFQASEQVIADNRDYLLRHQPIGCRDAATLAHLRKHGVDGHVTGCLTLAFDEREAAPRKRKIIVPFGAGSGSFPAACLAGMPPRDLENVEFVFQRLVVSRCPLSCDDMRNAEIYARHLLDHYRTHASLVVTPLHHAATPCISSGIPVILCRNDLDDRFSYLKSIIDIHVAPDFSKIDWRPEPVDISGLRERLVGETADRLRRAASLAAERRSRASAAAPSDASGGGAAPDARSAARQMVAASKAGNHDGVLAIYEGLSDPTRAELEPDWSMLAVKAFLATKRPREAAALCQGILRKDPSHRLACANHIIALLQSGQTDAAYKAALAVEDRSIPDAAALLHAARAAQAARRPDDAIRMLEKAVGADPRNASVRVLLAALLGRHRGDWASASRHADRAVALKPDDHDAKRLLGEACLQMGDYGKGFAHYIHRLKSAQFHNKYDRPYPHKIWDGKESGLKLLMLPENEQGIGFELLCSTLIPDLNQRGVSVVFEASEKLIPFLQSLYPCTEFVPFASEGDERLRARDITAQAYFTQLCLHLRRDIGDFMRHAAGRPPSRLTRPADRALRIGIAWSSANPVFGPERSIELAQWRLLVEASPFPVHLVNLQYGDVAADLADFAETTGIVVERAPDVDYRDDIGALLRAIRSVDLVVSIDNSTVFLAALCDKPVYMLASANPHWIWTATDRRSVWLPCVEIFRKRPGGDWSELFVAIVHALAVADSSQAC